MFDDTRHDSEGIDTEPRTVRALTEYHSVLDDVRPARGADGLYTVVSQSGKSYTVDARTGACSCPDATHNLDVDDGERCKHARRVGFATGERPIPADVAAVVGVDPDLGQHVDGVLRFVAADGGIIEAGDDGEILDDGDDSADESTDEGDESGADARPDGCDCGEWNDGLSIPCWPCYRDGFEGPTPASAGDE